jgi:transcriptional regulator with XRE-family HTH domain
MGQKIANLLREWREERHLSLGGLALRAGVNKSTLSRWEAGIRQPGIHELEAVLDALDITPRQRAQALSRIEAPRAIQRLRRMAENAPPVSGDLLRAMRLRQGLTQEAVAAQAGVRQSTLARWERGEEWPSVERLHTLCYLLDAQEAELVALTRGPWLTGKNDRVSLEELIDEFFELVFQPYQDALKDFRFLSLEARLWTKSAQEEAVRPWLSDLYARHIMFLMERNRMREAQSYAQRIKQNEAMLSEPPRRWSPVVNALARVATFAGRRPDPKKGLQILFDAQHLSMSPEDRAWAMSEIAEYIALAGGMESALALSRKACQVAEQETPPIEVWHRKRNMVLLLIQAGRAEEALPLIPADDVTDFPPILIYEALLWTETLLALGRVPEAYDWLQRAYAEIEAMGLFSLRCIADALSQRLPVA